MKFYWSSVQFKDDMYQPVCVDTLSSASVHDGRPDVKSTSGIMLVSSDSSPSEHSATIALSGIIYIPFEDGGGADLTLADPLSSCVTDYVTPLEDQNVPVDNCITVGDAITRAVRMCALRRIAIASLDPTGLKLTDILATLAQSQQLSLLTQLASKGFDVSAITPAQTLRQALVNLLSQANAQVFGP